jgi:hypothetical protein
MPTRRPVRMTGSFPSAMRRRTVFSEQPLICAYSLTVSSRSRPAVRASSFFVIAIVLLILMERRQSVAGRQPRQQADERDEGVTTGEAFLACCRLVGCPLGKWGAIHAACVQRAGGAKGRITADFF